MDCVVLFRIRTFGLWWVVVVVRRLILSRARTHHPFLSRTGGYEYCHCIITISSIFGWEEKHEDTSWGLASVIGIQASLVSHVKKPLRLMLVFLKMIALVGLRS